MKRQIILAIAFLLSAAQMWASYTGSLPYTVSKNKFTVDGYTFSTADGYYQEWDHYVIFWSTGYGSKTNATTIGSGDYLLNLTQMKEYAELCYDNYTALGFLDPTSSDGGGHKIIILAYYSTDWFATGSGVKTSSGIWGVLNIAHSSANPSATNPYYTFCHEIGHAYQYLGYAKNGGNAGFNYESGKYGWVSYYECCGNWQAAQEYQNLYFPQSMSLYMKTTNLAFTHSWHCYQSYPLNDYITARMGSTAIGDIWTVNTTTAYAEPLEKYMTTAAIDATELYRQLFFAAMRMTTWDLDRWQTYLAAEGKTQDVYMDHRMGTQAGTNGATTTPTTYSDTYYPTSSTYQYVTTNSSKAIHQVAYSSAPQSSGFNCIKLNVPTGTNRTITTTFTALQSGASLASGDNKEYWMGSMWAKSSSQSAYNTGATAQCNATYSTYKSWRGFRLGYVAYKKNGSVRYYNYTDKVYCTGTSESSASLSFTVPEDVDSVYFIVSPALSNYLRNESSGSYDISSNSDYVSFQQSFDQWPYRVQFYNTNIYGLSNPSTTFSGTADSGTTYTSAKLPDLSATSTEKTYTITLATGSPQGAGYEVTDLLTSIGNNQYTTTSYISSANVSQFVTAKAVDGYKATVTISGTDITISYTEKVEHLTISRNLTFPTTTDYSGTTYTLSTSDLSLITNALGCTSTALKSSGNWETDDSYTELTPSDGKFFLYAVEPTTEELNPNTTANGYGYWMDSDGAVITYGDGAEYYMEYAETTGVFTFGQMPSALSTGNTNTLRFALLYTNASGETSSVYFNFNITIASTTTTKYAYEIVCPSIGSFTTKNLTENSTFGNYESSAEITSSNVGSYVTPGAVSGYTTAVSVSGSTITISYTKDATLVGDVNNDGKVDIADIATLVSMLNGKATVTQYPNYDVDGDKDSGPDLDDLDALVNLILGKQE